MYSLFIILFKSVKKSQGLARTNQEPRTQSKLPIWMAGTQLLDLLLAASQHIHKQEAAIGSQILVLQAGTLMEAVGVIIARTNDYPHCKFLISVISRFSMVSIILLNGLISDINLLRCNC